MDIETNRLKTFSQRSPFIWLGHATHCHRKWVIFAWALLVAFSLAVIPQLETMLKETGAVYESGSAYEVGQLLQQELQIPAEPITIVFHAPQSLLTNSNSQIAEIQRSLRSLPAVKSVISAQERPEYRSADGKTEYNLIYLNEVYLKEKNQESSAAIAAIEKILPQGDRSALQTYLTGKAIIDRDVQQISKADLGQIEAWVLPLTLITLIIVFGSLVAAAMPVAMGVMTVSVTFGMLYLIALKLNVSVFALNLTTMLGLGLGIDYSLLIVNRFREELQTTNLEQAIAHTLDTAGRAVFFSGLTVCIGLVCLTLFPIQLLQSLGIAGSLVVLLSVAAALTLLPALLSFTGHWIHQGRATVRLQVRWERFWTAIAQSVTRHSLLAVTVVLVLVAGLTAPFLQANFGLISADILPQATPSRQGIDLVKQSFGAGEVTPILLVAQTKNPGDRILSENSIGTLYDLVAQLQTDPRIDRVTSLVNLDPTLTRQTYQQLYQNPSQLPTELAAIVPQLSHGSTTLISIKSRTASNDPASRALVEDLRQLRVNGLRLQVGGQTATELDTIAAIYQRFPIVLLTLMIATFALLYLLLGSIVLPLKAIVMNLLSIGASFGAVVFIFQQGNFQTWLNFTPVGYLDILLPVVLFCVLFGLSMDYEVFLLTRIKEAYDRTQNNSQSVIEGLERTGGIITSAALLMILVTSAFAFANIIFVKALGLGCAIAIAIDATLIRVILVPATMHLLGKWNWWSPSFLVPSNPHSAGRDLE